MHEIQTEPFGQLPDGREVTRFTLTNANGMIVRVINYGGIIQQILVPDRDGNLADVVLGEPDLAGYLDHHPHYGAITGRFANRIRNGQFVLNGHQYQLPKNKDGLHCLHGGAKGFDKRLWSADTMTDGGDSVVHLSYTSPHEEEGFPGELETVVSYRLTENNELRIDYAAHSNRTTIINLTNHSYFNLGGQENLSARDHEVCIKAPYFAPTDEADIPTGEILSVEGTDFDFQESALLDTKMKGNHPQLVKTGGFDHSFVFGKRHSDRPWDCRVVHQPTGRTMEVLTSEPCVQLYTGNSLGETEVAGKNGKTPVKHQALCLETQHLPDSPNIPYFPSTRLEPEETFRSFTTYRFGVL
ncbi:aldose epimerase family protein [Puniceicoccus vermicola]|uniref:Aldose 1-epimerase n=1 Tax=Puniceicoccus vermicola TaxID=388746 RepID=A0A7X1B118_9BACT|nr:aldose epimerase family protein [Puniceicoccus vermicola]MBC2603582.1 galactose mutarotase [Puniceicoccus vermicola]